MFGFLFCEVWILSIRDVWFLDLWRFGMCIFGCLESLDVWVLGGLEVWMFGFLKVWVFRFLAVWRFGSLGCLASASHRTRRRSSREAWRARHSSLGGVVARSSARSQLVARLSRRSELGSVVARSSARSSLGARRPRSSPRSPIGSLCLRSSLLPRPPRSSLLPRLAPRSSLA